MGWAHTAPHEARPHAARGKCAEVANAAYTPGAKPGLAEAYPTPASKAAFMTTMNAGRYQTSSSNRSGFSIDSFTRTRKLTASFPSTMRWS